MPTDTASTSRLNDQQVIEFLILCLENSGKTNFEEVAKHSTHSLDAASAYKKLWYIKRKFQTQKSNASNTTSRVSSGPGSTAKVTKPKSLKTEKVVSRVVKEEDVGWDMYQEEVYM